MKRGQRLAILLLACWIAVAFAGTDVSALTVQNIRLEQTVIAIENNSDAFITGTVSTARGQKISVLAADGSTALARVTAGNSGNKETFQIRIPAEYITQSGSTTLYVQGGSLKGLTASEKFRVTVKSREKKKAQGLKVPSKKIVLTNLKTSARIKASSASGEKILYQSSKPSIVSVDKNGKLKRKKNGKVKIAICQKETDVFRAEEKTLTVVSRKSTRKEQIDAAVAWAVKIAADNSFSYGAGRSAHHNGCYFCGTNYGPRKYMKPSKRYKKTYCCNPFIHAAYAHGAKNPKMLAGCRRASGIGMEKKTYRKFRCWKCVGKPSYKKLQKGDVLVRHDHVAMYIGRHRMVEASGASWSASSISAHHMSKKDYRKFSFVMRYTGY
ncbi:MAG: Ig-like domain-containing protein [Firmicutes bacterium]|nr:Ig-like domain-containing protein [Bacillota bacterium]